MKTLKNRFRIVTDNEYFYIQKNGFFGWHTLYEEQVCIDGLAHFEDIKFNTKNEAKIYLVGMFKKRLRVAT